MAGITVRALRDDLGFGSAVDGVTWDTLADAAVRAELNAIFEDRGLIIFEGVEPSAKMQAAISRVFGPLKDHPTRATARVDEDEIPGVIDMHHVPGKESSGGPVEVDGKLVVRFSPWHFDHCYNDKLNRAGVLRAVVNAPEGGRTGFADGIDLYRKLSPEMRAKIEGLNIIYTLDVRLSQMRFGRNFKDFGDTQDMKGIVDEARVFPRAIHPAVWTRATGEKVLHATPWQAFGIENHEDAAGEALYEEFSQELIRLAYANSYWHDWKPTDMIIWDNWRMIHAVEGCDARYERRTQRTTINGDYGLGRFEHGKKVGEVYRTEVPDLVMAR